MYRGPMKLGSRSMALTLAVFATQGALVACSDSDSGSSGSSLAGNTTRSPTCLAFQDAACDWTADKCKTVGRAECDNLLQSLFCKADLVMQACIDGYATAPCGAPPAACHDVADKAPAQQLCSQFIDQWCSYAERCKADSKAECVAKLAESVKCSTAVGISPSFPQCQADIDALACPAAGATFKLPEPCNGAVKTWSSSDVSSEPGPGWRVDVVAPVAASLLVR